MLFREQTSFLSTLKLGTCKQEVRVMLMPQASGALQHEFVAAAMCKLHQLFLAKPPTSPAKGLPLLLRAMSATGLLCCRSLADSACASMSCLKEPAAPMARGPSDIADAALGSCEPKGASSEVVPRLMVGVFAAYKRGGGPSWEAWGAAWGRSRLTWRGQRSPALPAAVTLTMAVTSGRSRFEASP